MKKLIYISLLLITFTGYSQEESLINAVALPNGSYMVKTPPSYKATNLMGGAIANYSPEALFDLSSKMWCTAKNTVFGCTPHFRT